MKNMSCLFHSLSKFTKQSAEDVRGAVCDYLERGGRIIDGLDTSDILKLEHEDYINNMRKSSTWGGAIEIQAACNVYAMRVFVVDMHTKRYIEFLPLDAKVSTEAKLMWSGSHYEPVLTIDNVL